VATLVAEGAQPADVFGAVAEEVGELVAIDGTRILRYEPDGTATIVGGWWRRGRDEVPLAPELGIGSRVVLDGDSIPTRVFRTGLPARIDDDKGVDSSLAGAFQRAGIYSGVGAPIVVEGRLWGVMVAGAPRPEPLPPGLESRLAQFTELVATAIANAETRAELTASRARIVAASDETRRRIERDLHDGAQQRLVSLGLELRAAEQTIPDELPELEARIGSLAAEVDGVLDDLREMSRGIHPAILSEGGLAPALRALARRATVPVELELGSDIRLAEAVEVAAYYVVSEALTNTAKHAGASRARVAIAQQNGRIRLSIGDDGIGGADAVRGTGLIGLRDRVEALGGSLTIVSPLGDGTIITVDLPADDGDVRPSE
jgi:signal transduction histidine kinase